jgi:3-hydroxybutyryl-CoA dehydrogenase
MIFFSMDQKYRKFGFRVRGFVLQVLKKGSFAGSYYGLPIADSGLGLTLRKFFAMTIALLADNVLKEEWLSREAPAGVEFVWADSLSSLLMIEAAAYFDLLYTVDPERMARLKPVNGKPLFVNAVPWTGKVTGTKVIRINAWPTLLRRPVIEIALTASEQSEGVKSVFDALQWRYQLVPDIAGMITPRVLAMIVNEAYFTLGAEVSTRAEIDTAMKLGTNYPMGPFEWSAAIGLENIAVLLKELSRTDERYTLAPALEQELTTGVSYP